jgi:cellulose biosynthesis protein BcsQ
MKIAVIAKKGGAGKSTLCLVLHEAFTHNNFSAAIQDWDSQGTSNWALEMFGGTIAQPGDAYHWLIYDTSPNLAHIGTLTAAKVADLILIPTSPSPADMREAWEAVEFAKKHNPKALIRLVLNRAGPTTTLGKKVAQIAEALPAPLLAPSLGQRECYQHMFGKGWDALEVSAQLEATALAMAIMRLFENEAQQVA